MSEIDAFFRPAAIALTLLTTLLLLRDAWSDGRARLAALFGAGTAAYILCSSGPGISGAGWLLIPLCIGNGVFFWWFAQALLDDDFRIGGLQVAVLVTVLALGFARVGSRLVGLTGVGQALALVHNLIILALVAHVLVSAWRGYDDDLLESRRRFRLVFLACSRAAGGSGSCSWSAGASRRSGSPSRR